MSFRDRTDAGRRLAEALKGIARSSPFEHPAVLALRRGGVPVGFEVARELGAPLEVLIVRKIGAPGHAELGFGAVVDGSPPQVVLNPAVMEMVRPSQAHVEAETENQIEEMGRRRRTYIGERTPLETRDRTVMTASPRAGRSGRRSRVWRRHAPHVLCSLSRWPRPT